MNDRIRFGLLPFIARLLLVSEFLTAVNGKVFGWTGQAAFWHQTATGAGLNQTPFFKNLGMMGGLLMIAVYGPGSWTIRPAGASNRAAIR